MSACCSNFPNCEHCQIPCGNIGIDVGVHQEPLMAIGICHSLNDQNAVSVGVEIKDGSVADAIVDQYALVLADHTGMPVNKAKQIIIALIDDGKREREFQQKMAEVIEQTKLQVARECDALGDKTKAIIRQQKNEHRFRAKHFRKL